MCCLILMSLGQHVKGSGFRQEYFGQDPTGHTMKPPGSTLKANIMKIGKKHHTKTWGRKNHHTNINLPKNNARRTAHTRCQRLTVVVENEIRGGSSCVLFRISGVQEMPVLHVLISEFCRVFLFTLVGFSWFCDAFSFSEVVFCTCRRFSHGGLFALLLLVRRSLDFGSFQFDSTGKHFCNTCFIDVYL